MNARGALPMLHLHCDMIDGTCRGALNVWQQALLARRLLALPCIVVTDMRCILHQDAMHPHTPQSKICECHAACQCC